MGLRIKGARFPGDKALDDVNFDDLPTADRNLIADLGTSVFLTEGKDIVFLGPPGTGKTHLAVGTGIKAAKAGHRVLFDTATRWVARLQKADSRGKLPAPLVSSRYGHASLIMTSFLPFARWGDAFGDLTIASAMIDRIVHHPDVINLKGTS